MADVYMKLGESIQVASTSSMARMRRASPSKDREMEMDGRFQSLGRGSALQSEMIQCADMCLDKAVMYSEKV